MLCPICRSAVCRRSMRRGWRDHTFAAILALRPWRCRTCETRFYAWRVPVRFAAYVHCPRCGNLDVRRTARDRVVEGWFSGLFRRLRTPAYRCDDCRQRFFSLRRYHCIEPTRVETLVEEPSAGPQTPADLSPDSAAPAEPEHSTSE